MELFFAEVERLHSQVLGLATDSLVPLQRSVL